MLAAQADSKLVRGAKKIVVAHSAWQQELGIGDGIIKITSRCDGNKAAGSGF